MENYREEFRRFHCWKYDTFTSRFDYCKTDETGKQIRWSSCALKIDRNCNGLNDHGEPCIYNGAHRS